MKELEDFINEILDTKTFISLVQSLINESLRVEERGIDGNTDSQNTSI